MIIDCHTHLYCPGRGSLAAEHRRLCASVDGCLTLAGFSDDYASANKALTNYLDSQPKAYGLLSVNPLTETYTPKSLKALLSHKTDRLVGVTVYCAEDGYHPCHSQAMRLYEAAQEIGVLVFFHNCPPYSASACLEFAQPVWLDEIARTFPNLTIIVGRLGEPFENQTFALLGKHEKVFADLTIHPEKIWQVYQRVRGAYEAGVMDKLLFGSGFPYAEPAACIETLLGLNKLLADTHLPQAPREKLRSVVERDSWTTLGIKKD